MKFNCKEDIIQLTPEWKGDRCDDGRPRVPDDILARIAKNTITELWKIPYMRGYKYQFEASLKCTNPSKLLVGRAVTAEFMPTRPDLHKYLMDYGHKEEGRKGNFNQWAIEGLVKDDVLIYDMKGKVYEGCPLGGNLTNTIYRKTGQGAVTWGGMRDLEQVVDISDANFFYIEKDPTPFMDSMLLGINVPVKIGVAVCMPGDVVVGTTSGLLFIPPHLAEETVVSAEKDHLRDIWGFIRIKEKKYTAAQVDSAWELVMWEDFHEWSQNSKEAEAYNYLNFDQELSDAREGIIRHGITGEILRRVNPATGEEIKEDKKDGSEPGTRW